MNDKSLKVLIVNGTAPPDISGSGLRALRLAEHISTKENLHTTFCSYSLVSDKYIYTIKNIRFTTKILHIFTYPINLFINIRKFLQNKYQIIHFFGFGLITINILMVIKLLPKYRPKIIFSTTMSKLDDAEGIREKKFGNKIIRLIKKMDVIIANSDLIYDSWTKEFAEKNQFSNSIIKLLPPVNLIRFSPDPCKFKEDNTPIKLNYTGAIKSRKNIIFLLQSVEIYKKLFDEHIYIDIIGSPKGTGYMAKVEQYIKQNNLSSNVKFHGFQENTNEYYCKSDIFVFSSTNEGIPNVCIEAISSGLPIIAKKIEGVTSEFIINNHNGYEIDNPTDMAKMINVYHTDRKKLNEHSLNSRRLAEKKFSSKIIYSKYLEIYLRYI